jgi:signal transduction histidine kinase
MSEPSSAAARAGWAVRVVRTPLLTKLVLLDLAINAVAWLGLQAAPTEWVQEVTLVSLGLVLVLNAGLVAWALQPLQVLEDTARRVSSGEVDARTQMPRFADRNLVRIGATLDLLLDRVASERARVRALAAEVVAAGDAERARIARELHDGTAQSLTALEMLLSSMLTRGGDPKLLEKVDTMRGIAADALEEVRALSHSLHPRVLDDLGLAAALEHLARVTREQFGVNVTVRTEPLGEAVPSRPVASVLYRVAQEALNNAAKHARARNVAVHLGVEGGAFRLVVQDDGVGFEREKVEKMRHGMGLFVMQERVSLVDGQFDLATAPGNGTRVRVSIPVQA